jgi:hypothetical protein
VSESSLTIAYSNEHQPARGELNVRLEQIKKYESQETVTMYDIQQMVARAKAGMSAKTYKPDYCPAYISGMAVMAEFDFWAWPSSTDLAYTVKSSFGEVSPRRTVVEAFEISMRFELSDNVEFDFVVDRISSMTWETHCYNTAGEQVGRPALEMDGATTLRADFAVFGVVRVKGYKRGDQYRITAALEDFQTVRITDLTITATATWMVGTEEKIHSITMETPQCLKDLIESCWVDTDGDGIPDSPPGDYFGPNWFLQICGAGANKPPMNVYVSACTGKILATRRANEDNSQANWCGRDRT